MAVKKTPKHDVWMPLYVSEYLGDTMHLTVEQHGAYLLLLMAAWKNDGKLPSDPGALQQISHMSAAQWMRNEHTLQAFFFVTEDFWLHNRVRIELDKAKEHVARKSRAGQASAAARWGIKT
jgi:uncharacterized protein YdaU (DUF1376 family)